MFLTVFTMAMPCSPTVFMSTLVAGVITVAGGTGHHSTIEELLSFITTCRMTIPYLGWVAGTALKKGEINQKTRSIERAGELGTAVAELAKLTSPLRQQK
jgi:hypothetical protein